MKKIYIDFDTNGGNGAMDIDIVGFEALNSFHVKIQHRNVVMNKVKEYLEE